jgi:hypothetical protein
LDEIDIAPGSEDMRIAEMINQGLFDDPEVLMRFLEEGGP